MADAVPLKLDQATSLPAQLAPGDTVPDANLPTTVARISGATTIMVVPTLPGTPDPNTIYFTTT